MLQVAEEGPRENGVFIHQFWGFGRTCSEGGGGEGASVLAGDGARVSAGCDESAGGGADSPLLSTPPLASAFSLLHAHYFESIFKSSLKLFQAISLSCSQVKRECLYKDVYYKLNY